MVFSTTATAFLHLSEHQLEKTLSTHQHHADQQHHENHDIAGEHAHHFNLHVVGDLTEFESLSIVRSANLASCYYSSQLISRTYSPPIPPPNA
jgi:hypothetical protein